MFLNDFVVSFSLKPVHPNCDAQQRRTAGPSMTELLNICSEHVAVWCLTFKEASRSIQLLYKERQIDLHHCRTGSTENKTIKRRWPSSLTTGIYTSTLKTMFCSKRVGTSCCSVTRVATESTDKASLSQVSVSSHVQ